MKLTTIININFSGKLLEEMGEDKIKDLVDGLVEDAESEGALVVRESDCSLKVVHDLSVVGCHNNVAELDKAIGIFNHLFKIDMQDQIPDLSADMRDVVNLGMLFREEVETDNPTAERAVRLIIGSRPAATPATM